MASHFTVVGTGIDYITATLPQTVAVDTHDIRYLVRLARREGFVDDANLRPEPWGWNGYAGRRVASVRWGAREDGSIIIISGAMARAAQKPTILDQMRASRLDIQATIKLEGVDPDAYIREITGVVSAALNGREGRKPKMLHANGFGAGDTLTVGSRHSSRYIRIYNKHAESGFRVSESGMLRLEIEYKAELAAKVWGSLASARDRAEEVNKYLAAEILSIGLTDVAAEVGVAGERPVYRRTDTEADGKLMWLEKSVRPVLTWLRDRGYAESVEEALGVRFPSVELDETQLSML